MTGSRRTIDQLLDEVMAAGAARANEVAERTLADVYDRVGFLPATRS